MRIGINGHLLSFEETYRQAGVSRYIEALLRELPGVAPDDDLVVFSGPVDAEDEGKFDPKIEWRQSRVRTVRPPVRIAWEQTAGPLAARRAGIDLMHFPVNVVTLSPSVPQVVTVHDLAFHHFPEQYPAAKQRYLRLMTRLSVGRARRVIAVSEATRQDVIRLYGRSPERVVAVPNGIGGEMKPLPPDRVAEFRRERELPEEFFLFLGTLQPRKNLETLLRAYAMIANEVAWPLIVAGAAGWQYDRTFGLVRQLGLSERVRFVGYVAGDELPLWYNAATVFVYPSLYEGFGLPVLEAMACGTPAIASNTSSLPEVVGDAGLTIDPTDTRALASAMLAVARDGDLRQQLGQRGRERAREFGWRRTAELTVEVYRQALCGGR